MVPIQNPLQEPTYLQWIIGQNRFLDQLWTFLPHLLLFMLLEPILYSKYRVTFFQSQSRFWPSFL